MAGEILLEFSPRNITRASFQTFFYSIQKKMTQWLCSLPDNYDTVSVFMSVKLLEIGQMGHSLSTTVLN